MFKSLLLVLALGSASASTIATVSCDGNTASDPTMAQCTGMNGQFPDANAMAQAGMPYGFLGVDVNASAGGSGTATANATLSGTYLFTVTGGTGGGFFLPCIGAYEDFGNSSASFTGYSVFGTGGAGNNICSFEGLASATPFAYGVGQQVVISMDASSGTAGYWQHPSYGTALLGDIGNITVPFLFWDSNGQPLSNVSFSLTEIPEPGSFAALSIAFLMLVLAQRRYPDRFVTPGPPIRS
ncbi:MAG TPA: hypothetical protein VGV35_08880 [Bryobacteraceae bacterium]|nr:hypothetical protein [Bryobacteraceae bacterium]